jgi:hypothetical protein
LRHEPSVEFVSLRLTQSTLAAPASHIIDWCCAEHYDRVQRLAVLREEGGDGLVDLRGTWPLADRAEAAS